MPSRATAQTTDRLPRGFRDRLVRRARRLGIDVPEGVTDPLVTYFELLQRWNRRINLTGIVDLDEAIDRLLLEPLAAARHIPAWVRTVLDVGSGGGSPAIPIKLARPAVRLIMIESKTRKAAFLREVVRQVGLSDVQVEGTRYEELLAQPAFHEVADLVTVRAIRTDLRTLAALEAFLRPSGWLFLFLSEADERAWGVSPPRLHVIGAYPLVTTLKSDLVILEKRPG
jgi:16S rRNA (guanine527-N7)-methyltransferase